MSCIISGDMLRARYRRIVMFFARVLLGLIFWDLFLSRIGLRNLVIRTRPERLRKTAENFRELAIRMGGVMIKVGQFLSSRADVLPVEITNELAGLQDEVPPVSFSDIRGVAEAEFGMPLEEKFAFFDPLPVAAASLGQVHRAQLHSLPSQSAMLEDQQQKPEPGQSINVVVKIQRPDIEKVIATDLAALRTVGRWVQRYRPIQRRVDVPTLMEEFTRVLYEEINYLAEGRNAETFRTNFQSYPGVRIPHVVWSHTTRRTLTLEDVWAIKITDYDSLAKAGIDRAQVASRLLDIYLKQIFEDGFFHADPHPGNLFVDPITQPVFGKTGPKPAWDLTFVDFGMVGRVPPNLLAGLRELIIALGTQDSARVIKSFQMMGVLLPSADLPLLEKAVAREFELFWGKDMSELNSVSLDEMREFANEFRELIYDMPFQVPQNMVFLGRCVGILSGMCTGLDPRFNLWDHLGPYARKLIAQDARQVLSEAWLAGLGEFARILIALPRKLDATLSRVERGKFTVHDPELSQQVSRLERAISQVAGGITFTALLLGGIQLLLGGEMALGIALLSTAGLNLVWVLLFARSRRNK